MPSFFSASLLTVVVVAGIAVVWLRSRSSRAKSKKTDGEGAGSNSVEIIVENGAPRSATKASAKSPSNQSRLSITDAISNTLSLDMVNRRQYVKAVCDRFESWTSKATESEGAEDSAGQVQARPISVRSQDSARLSGEPGSQPNAKPNNLSSFVRQCVSNIERSSFVASNRTISPRTSMSSNQADSPPKSIGRRLPNLATTTDCKRQEDYDPEEYAVEDDTPAKPRLSRTPSDLARSALAGKPPLLAPFAGTKPRSSTNSTLPPVWARMVKQETNTPASVPVANVKDAEPEDDESPLDENAQSPLLLSMQDDVPVEPEEPVVIPPPPRKISNGAARLQQFQQLVPSNQARISY